MEEYDFVIIGAGVAGLAAGMYSARLGLKTLILGSSYGSDLPVGGTITTTHMVENYPGFIKISGAELADRIKKHAESYDLATIRQEKANSVKKTGKKFLIETNKNSYVGRTLLFATGKEWRKLDVPGGREFENKGVAYCALCQPPDEDIIANHNIINIGDITPSTKVLTREGNYQKIGGFSRTKYSGELVKIIPRFFTEPVKLTPNHPVLVIGIDRGNSANYLKNPKFSGMEWKEAGDLKKGDCVVYPILKDVKDKEYIKLSDYLELREEGEKIIPHKKTHTAKKLINNIITDKNFFRLVGYYLAEGSSSRHQLVFYFHKKEKKYIDDVSYLMKKYFGLESKISYRDNVGIVSIYSRVVADLFKILFDKYSHLKNVPHFMMFLPLNKQTELIKGLWRGDGCTREKDFTLVTNSKKMAYQVRDILLRLGIIASIQIRKKEDLNRKSNQINGRDISFTKDKYHVGVGGQFLEKMSEILGIEHPLLKRRKQTLKHAWIYNNFAVLPIREIERSPYEGDVFSIGVENSHSYVAKNFVVHNCDAPLYKNKIVCVIGGSDVAVKDALLLSEYAKKVYVIYRKERIRSEPINLKRIESNKKIEIIKNTNVVEVKGKDYVESVILDKEYNGSKELKVDGVFVAIGRIALSGLAKKLGVKLNKSGEIIINRKTSETNVAGVFAAGDITDRPFKQAIIGVSEGCVASHSAYEYCINE